MFGVNMSHLLGNFHMQFVDIERELLDFFEDKFIFYQAVTRNDIIITTSHQYILYYWY